METPEHYDAINKAAGLSDEDAASFKILREKCHRVLQLIDDPHPGLSTWNECTGRALRDLYATLLEELARGTPEYSGTVTIGAKYIFTRPLVLTHADFEKEGKELIGFDLHLDEFKSIAKLIWTPGAKK